MTVNWNKPRGDLTTVITNIYIIRCIVISIPFNPVPFCWWCHRLECKRVVHATVPHEQLYTFIINNGSSFIAYYNGAWRVCFYRGVFVQFVFSFLSKKLIAKCDFDEQGHKSTYRCKEQAINKRKMTHHQEKIIYLSKTLNIIFDIKRNILNFASCIYQQRQCVRYNKCYKPRKKIATSTSPLSAIPIDFTCFPSSKNTSRMSTFRTTSSQTLIEISTKKKIRRRHFLKVSTPPTDKKRRGYCLRLYELFARRDVIIID